MKRPLAAGRKDHVSLRISNTSSHFRSPHSPFLIEGTGSKCEKSHLSRSLSPESPRCCTLHRRSLPGLVFQSPSLVLTEQEPELWQTSKQKPSWSKHKGQQPQQLLQLLQPPQLEGPFQDLALGVDKVQERVVKGKLLEEGVQAQTQSVQMEKVPCWNWPELEAGEVRENFYPVVLNLRPIQQAKHSLLVSLEHNYSKPPQCLQNLPSVERVQASHYQPT